MWGAAILKKFIMLGNLYLKEGDSLLSCGSVSGVTDCTNIAIS
jgi:hypothetical protein